MSHPASTPRCNRRATTRRTVRDNRIYDVAVMVDGYYLPRSGDAFYYRRHIRGAVYTGTVEGAAPILPYADGCQHLAPCANVYAGRACALDATKRNGYTPEGKATVSFLADDVFTGTAAGSVLLALDPYTGRPSGTR